MNISDIVALAKAGFTAEQISAMNQPQPQPQPQPAAENAVLAEIRALTAAIQANGIINSNQPPVQTVDDILASIINPNNNKEVK